MPLTSYKPLQMRNLSRSLEAHVPAKALRDVTNRLRYGPEAPVSDECLWVDPRRLTLAFRPNQTGSPRLRFRRHHSGAVIGGDWDRVATPFAGNVKHKAVMAHFRDGVPWEETGIIDEILARIARHGSFDGLRTRAEVLRRYAALDDLAEEARQLGRLRARSEMPGARFRREHGGVMVHIARDGTPLRAGGGIHRCAIAQALELPLMPVQLGVIHPEALAAGALRDLRRAPDDLRPA
jgi:hypothetical protein